MISAAILILIAWQFIWFYSEWKNKRVNPKTKPTTISSWIKRAMTISTGVFGYLQLSGRIELFTFSQNAYVITVGFVLLVIGFLVSLSARLTLGTNWAHAAEYQILKNQQLIDSGIYGFVRHPIYIGFVLAWVGIELMASSYLFIIILITFSLAAYMQAKKEEKILLKHFGSRYRKYMNRTKMFVPWVI